MRGKKENLPRDRSLSGKQRQFLRAQAHSLSPLVMIGSAGLTFAVVKECDRALAQHELIKVRIASSGDRLEREHTVTDLCMHTHAQPIALVGKVLIVYRAAAEPRLVLPE